MGASSMATPRRSLLALDAKDRRKRETQRLETLAARVRQLRDQRGMSRKLFAEQSGVSLPHIARLEAGDGNVSVLVLERLARALGVPLEMMFMADDGDSVDRSLIIEFVRKQPTDQLPALRRSLIAHLGNGLRPHRRIVLLGIRGAGKSSVGELLARRLELPFVELDREIEREANTGLDEIFALYGQSGYRTLERTVLERVLMQQPEVVLAPGGGIVTEPNSYELVMRTCFTVWLHAKHEVYYQRSRAQRDWRIASPVMRRQAMDSIRRTMAARSELYSAADLSIDSTDLSVEQVTRRIVSALKAADRAAARRHGAGDVCGRGDYLRLSRAWAFAFLALTTV